MKPDEREFLLKLASIQVPHYGGGIRLAPREFATDVGVEMGIPINRVVYILKKWSNKDWWNYGVSLRTGWLTKKGLAKAEELAKN